MKTLGVLLGSYHLPLAHIVGEENPIERIADAGVRVVIVEGRARCRGARSPSGSYTFTRAK